MATTVAYGALLPTWPVDEYRALRILSEASWQDCWRLQSTGSEDKVPSPFPRFCFQLTIVDLAQHSHFLLKYVLGLVYGLHIRNGCGEQ